jgi:hypothetical protein
MRRVERLLGLSEGYLSKVSNSRSEPSAELVSNLGLISMNPTSRLHDLETFWTLSKKRTSSMSRKSLRPSKASSAAIEQRP